MVERRSNARLAVLVTIAVWLGLACVAFPETFLFLWPAPPAEEQSPLPECVALTLYRADELEVYWDPDSNSMPPYDRKQRAAAGLISTVSVGDLEMLYTAKATVSGEEKRRLLSLIQIGHAPAPEGKIYSAHWDRRYAVGATHASESALVLLEFTAQRMSSAHTTMEAKEWVNIDDTAQAELARLFSD